MTPNAVLLDTVPRYRVLAYACDHGNHGLTRRVSVVAGLLITTIQSNVNFKDRAEIYFLFLFYVYNVVNKTCAYGQAVPRL